MKPRKGPLPRAAAQEISAEVDLILSDLDELLHAQDDAEIERRSFRVFKEKFVAAVFIDFLNRLVRQSKGQKIIGQRDEEYDSCVGRVHIDSAHSSPDHSLTVRAPGGPGRGMSG